MSYTFGYIVDKLVEQDNLEKPAAWQTWGIGMIIVTISAFSAPAGMLIVPLFSKGAYERIMAFLVALGIGALSGSIMFIMLPQAFGLSQRSDYLAKSAVILGALYIFFLIDRVLQYITEIRRRVKARTIHISTLRILTGGSNQQSESSYSSAKPIVYEYDDNAIKEVEHLAVDMELSEISNAIARRLSSRRRIPVIQAMRSRAETMRSRAETSSTMKSVNLKNTLAVPQEEDTVSVAVTVVEQKVVDPTELQIASVAYMIIFGSAANNFVDGMSNGVAFGDSLVRGLSIGLACVTQQFPQELGTLAILVQSGLGMKRTLLLNLIPAVLSYLGFIIGALIDNSLEGADDYVFAVSSGMYLYVFLGTLIPEVRESTNELIKTNIKESLIATAFQAIGIATGVVFMFCMANYGHRIKL